MIDDLELDRVVREVYKELSTNQKINKMLAKYCNDLIYERSIPTHALLLAFYKLGCMSGKKEASSFIVNIQNEDENE